MNLWKLSTPGTRLQICMKRNLWTFLFITKRMFFCNELPENSRVLKLGCGPVNITKYIVVKRNDLILEGIV